MHPGVTKTITSGRQQKTAINFKQFVLSHWNFCTLPRDLLPTFIYDIYSKIDDPNFLKNSVKEIFGSEWYLNTHTAKLMSNIQDLGEKITPRIFQEFCSNNPQYVHAAIEVQEVLRTKAMTALEWSSATSERASLSQGQLLTVSEYIRLRGLAANKNSLNSSLAAATDVNVDKIEGNGEGAKMRKRVSRRRIHHDSSDNQQEEFELKLTTSKSPKSISPTTRSGSSKSFRSNSGNKIFQETCDSETSKLAPSPTNKKLIRKSSRKTLDFDERGVKTEAPSENRRLTKRSSSKKIERDENDDFSSNSPKALPPLRIARSTVYGLGTQ